jgi:hypothetical protein
MVKLKHGALKLPQLSSIIFSLTPRGNMSRLIDELNRMAKDTSQPMGFRAARPASSEPRILLIASLAQTGDADRLADCIDGADAVLLRLAKSGPAAKTLQKTGASLPDMPWGGWLEDIGAKKVETLVEAGCDFVVFPAASRVLAAPQDDKVGKILQVEASLGEGLLRAINDLPVDAVLATDTYEADGSVAWHHLMLLQRLANLLFKPLLTMAPLNVTAGELKALMEAGVDGVVVEADAGQPGGLKELRRLINELPPRSLRKGSKTGVLLPYAGSAKDTETEEEEEEEYE